MYKLPTWVKFLETEIKPSSPEFLEPKSGNKEQKFVPELFFDDWVDFLEQGTQV